MSAYSGYSSNVPILPIFLMFCVAGLVMLSLLGGTAVQTATPKPTPDEETGIHFDDAVAEARSLITNLKPGEQAYLSKSTCGLVRVGYSRGGVLYVTPGRPSHPALDALAERILAALVY